jgi:hypothetical protein
MFAITWNRRFVEMKRFLGATAGGLGVLLVLFLALTTGLTGCGGSSSDEVPEISAFVGTWTLYDGNTVQGSPVWYVHFKEDKTFFISNNANGTGVRVFGTWTESDGALVGPFTNPRVGEGRVEATITNNIMHLDFIEYWHTPNKVIPYSGTKL